MKFTKKSGGQIIGELILTRLVGNEWEISYLKVGTVHRGKKIATDLLEKAKSYAIKKGLMLVAFVEPANDGGLTEPQIKSWLVKRGFKHSWYDFNKDYKWQSWHRPSTNNSSVTLQGR